MECRVWDRRAGGTGQEGCRTVEMQDRWDAGQAGCRTGVIQDRYHLGQVSY